MANRKFISKKIMSKAIEFAKSDPECQKWARDNAGWMKYKREGAH
jgi:hypothetical protein